MLDAGITVGLGTDVSGGYSGSILEATRQACLSSRLLGHMRCFDDEEEKEGKADSILNGDGSGSVRDMEQGAQSVAKPPLGHEKLSVDESLYLATRGGAAVLDMEGDIGGFEEGMLWDAQLIELGAVKDVTGLLEGVNCGRVSDLEGPVGNVDIFGTETWQEKIQKWVWGGDDRNVKAVWVGGTLVHSRR